jgi:hypothetical protein
VWTERVAKNRVEVGRDPHRVVVGDRSIDVTFRAHVMREANDGAPQCLQT